MDNFNFKINDDNAQRIFLTEDTLDVCEILQDYYGYIYDSMREEGIILKYEQCNLFKELVFDNKVVGFCSYDFSRQFITAAMNNIYVMPDFRGNHLFLDELKKTMEEHNKPSIMEPTRLVVELLIKYGLACRLNENIVASAIEFVIPGDHVLSNADYGNEELSTHFYDLSICASIHILDLKRGHVAYSAPLNYDIIHYDCLDWRDNINDGYFRKITELFNKKDVEFMKTILDLEEKLLIKNYTLDEVIGKGDDLSFYIESLIDDAHVSLDKALRIKQQIREEYEAGMIVNESLLIRLAYLFGENRKPTITSHDDTCHYCDMPVDSHDKFCHFCGINLNYNPQEMEDSLHQTINSKKTDFEEDIRFVAYKFLKLIDEKIDIDYSIYTIEHTYNIDWQVLESFLEKNNYFEDNQITQKGHEFLNTHPLHFWEKFHMDVINYTDFENYFYQHENSNPIEICLDYLENLEKDEYILEIIDEINNCPH